MVGQVKKNEEEQRAADENKEKEQRLTQERRQQATLQAYYDRMTELLLDKGLRTSKPESEIRGIAYAHTLTTLRNINGERKGHLLQFLYEADLITDNPPIIKLEDASLQTTNLFEAFFPEINLRTANLQGANLSRTYLVGANLQGCKLQEANLQEAELDEVILQHADLQMAYLQGAKLTGASLGGAIFKDTYYNARTQWPEGFEPTKHEGLILVED